MFKNAAARILPRNYALALRRKRSSQLPPRRQVRRAVSTFVALVYGWSSLGRWDHSAFCFPCADDCGFSSDWGIGREDVVEL